MGEKYSILGKEMEGVWQVLENLENMDYLDLGLCFSGHRPEMLPQTPEGMGLLDRKLHEELMGSHLEGHHIYYTGMCRGFDLLATQHLLYLGKKIELIAVVPFLGQEKSWTWQERNLYVEILDRASQVITLHQSYQKGCYHERNRYMVDRCRTLVGYCDSNRGGTYYTMNYARKKGLKVVNLRDM